MALTKYFILVTFLIIIPIAVVNGQESEKIFTSERGGLNFSVPQNFDVIEKENRFLEGPDLIIDGPNPSDNISLVIYYDFPFKDIYSGLIQYRNVILNDDDSSFHHRVIEDISMDKWKVGDEVSGSFIYSINNQSGPLRGVETIFTTHNNRTYNMEFGTNALQFDSPYVQKTEDQLIKSIHWNS